MDENNGVQSIVTNIPSEDPVGTIKSGEGLQICIPQNRYVVFPQYHGDVAVEKDKLKDIAILCKNASNTKYHLDDLYLSIASLFAGVIISAIFSRTPVDGSLKCIFCYTLSPAGFVGGLVAFLYSRKMEYTSVKNLADQIMNYLPKEIMNK